RNLVQQITKNHKDAAVGCAHCGTTERLESAHIRGRDRNQIIDSVLEAFTQHNIVTVDIALFEERFKAEHHPLDKSILILCRPCHKKYDSQVADSEEPKFGTDSMSEGGSPSGFLPIRLIESVLGSFKRDLLRSRMAEIILTYSDGRVEKRIWKADKFSTSSSV